MTKKMETTSTVTDAKEVKEPTIEDLKQQVQINVKQLAMAAQEIEALRSTIVKLASKL